MKRTIIFILLLVATILTSCLSPSDLQHSCDCDYGNQSDYVIKGVNNFFDLEAGMECDKKCGFRRLIVHFYDSSDSSRAMHDLIQSNMVTVNTLNNDFALVCLLVDDETELPSNEQFEVMINEQLMKVHTVGQRNQAYQLKKFKCNTLPYFGIIVSSTDSIVGSFGYLIEIKKIDSIFSHVLTH